MDGTPYRGILLTGVSIGSVISASKHEGPRDEDNCPDEQPQQTDGRPSLTSQHHGEDEPQRGGNDRENLLDVKRDQLELIVGGIEKALPGDEPADRVQQVDPAEDA